MKFSIYDHFYLELIRQDDRWLAFRLGEGVKRPEPDVVIPPDIDETELLSFLDDIFHERASPRTLIRQLDQDHGSMC
ncbi:MAG: hypothetical protein B6245_24100 [Desulfobacteraceae bacterium 4572_88]|nr:MAG: hypothetical protein B6245_24100 [Desulfobacteraceae bacterium 4572_88]